MRRHIVLFAILVAIVVAVALIRPRRGAPATASASAVERWIEPSRDSVAPEEEEVAEPQTSSDPPGATKKETAGKVEPTPPLPVRPSILTVVDPNGLPVADAVVYSVEHSYAQLSSNPKVREWRTDERGELKIVLSRPDSAHFVSYKVDVGSGIAGEIRAGSDVTLKYEKSLTLSFKCTAPEGLALEGAEVILATEVLLGLRRDAYGNDRAIAITLPPRMLITDREGVCRFGAVLPPRLAKGDWPPVPGFCHKIKATWYTMKAQETIEKPPPGPVSLVLQQ